MEKIIKKAIEGGYTYSGMQYATNRDVFIADYVKTHRGFVLDPLFWQALGKACGWEPIKSDMADALVYSLSARTGIIPKTIWQKNALKFHEINLIQGFEKAVEYLEELIK